jgi:transcriptional regulator with GAF, ATPase, and Fis domain
MESAEKHGKLQIHVLGKSKSEPINPCKMVFATNRPLDQAICEGKLRPDFLYRCSSAIRFPTLREVFNRDRQAYFIPHLLYSVMKRRRALDESRGFLDIRLPEGLCDDSSPLRRSLSDFHWSGNFRTFDKWCGHLVEQRLISLDDHGWIEPREQILMDDWATWREQQYVEPDHDAPALVVSVPKSASRLRPEIYDTYRTLLRKAIDLSKDTAGKVSITRAASILGVDARTLKKKLSEFKVPS